MAIRNETIDGSALLTLDEEDLRKDLMISLGVVRKHQQWIQY